jgi:ferrochelatase
VTDHDQTNGQTSRDQATPGEAVPVGVLLMTYGSAVTSADVPAYLRSVYRGGDPDPALVKEFQRRYDLVGRSPLIDITRAQADALQRLLDSTAGPGAYRVEIGMLHSAPKIEEGITKLATEGVRRLIAIVLAPQYSPIIMGGYGRAVDDAAKLLGEGATVTVAGPWHALPGWLDTLTELTVEARARLAPETPVLFTAHSLPKAVVDRDQGYIDQLRQTIDGVVERAGIPSGQWRFAYQSAGHTPEEWLKPDLKDLLPGIKAGGHDGVLVVPVQFLADHLEILYDIDVAARDEAAEAGLDFHRIELPNTRPAFIRALAEVVGRELGLTPAS